MRIWGCTLAYAPKSTTIINAIITLLKAASGDARLSTPIKAYLQFPDFRGRVGYPAVVVELLRESFESNNLVVGTFNVQVYVTEARDNLLPQALRLMAHEVRQQITRDQKVTSLVRICEIDSIAYEHGFADGAGGKKSPAGRVTLQFSMKYKEPF